MLELAPAAQAGLYGTAFSGDTFNTAWYARHALPSEWSIDYLTGAGDDAVSERMLGFMTDSGIGVGHVVRVPGRTVGLYMIELQDGERTFIYWRGESAARRLADDTDALDRALAGADVIYFSGITLGILATAARARLLAAVGAARAAGSVVVFDPNLRPRLWPDTETMCAAITEAAAHCDIALPSHDDEAAYFGDADVAATAARYGRDGAGLVVVKNGAGEILVRQDGVIHRFTPPKVEAIVDTTAAGDSFNAAFLAAHLTGAPLGDAVAAGAALAGRVIGGRGALVDLG